MVRRPAATARLRRVDAILLFTLVPCWVAAFALHLRQVVSGRLAWVPVYASRPIGPGDFPMVVGFRSETTPDETGLQHGDRLVRAGDADLRGVGPVGFFARIQEQVDDALRVPVTYERGGRSGTVLLRLVRVEFPWRLIPLTLTFAVVGVLVLFRLPGSTLARTFLLAVLSVSLQWSFFFGGPRAQTYAWTAVFLVSTVLMFPLILRVPMLFPPEVAPDSGRSPRWPWMFSVLGPIAFTWVYGVPLPPTLAQPGLLLVDVAFIVALLAVLTRNYRRCGPIGRRQLKWVVYGISVAMVAVLAADVVATLVPKAWWLHDLAVAGEVVIPISILIAILRFNLFDIDRLIFAAAVYSLLSVVLIARSRRAVRRRARERHRRIVLRRELRGEARVRAGDRRQDALRRRRRRSDQAEDRLRVEGSGDRHHGRHGHRPGRERRVVPALQRERIRRTVCLPLPSSAGSWVLKGKPPTPSYAYKDATGAAGPCKSVKVKHGKLLQVTCSAKLLPIGYSLDEPAQGALGVRFTSGGKTYRATFGGDVTMDSGTRGKFKAKNAPAVPCASAPAPCP